MPNYVIHALIAGVAFLLTAAILGILLFANKDGFDLRQQTPPQVLEKLEVDTRAIVVLDAGHGGRDPGAVANFADKTEAEITQIMVERLAALLERHSTELRVVLAHEAGSYATTQQRASVALNLEAELFVSLHLNANTSAATRGFQVYPTPPGRVHHANSLRLAQMMVEEVRVMGIPVLGETGIYYAYYHELADGSYWQEQVENIWTNPEQPVESLSFGVLENAGCPAVLVEQWYITNQADMAELNNANGYDSMAGSLYRAICAYLGIAPIL